MILLLDTHVLLWWLEDSPRLGAGVRKAIEDEDRVVFVSMARLWEIAIKIGIGKLEADFTGIADGVVADNFTLLPISTAQLAAVIDLPPLHRDPFDRLLVAQATVDGLTVVTKNEQIYAYGIANLEA